MHQSLIGPVIAFGELVGYAQNQIAAPSATNRIPWELPVWVLLVSLGLFVVSLIVCVALTGLLVLSARGAQSDDGQVELSHARTPRERDTRIPSPTPPAP
jgi:hypothetical protein